VREEHDDLVAEFVSGQAPSRLSQAALETLAVIAYKQPVTRSQVAAIRAVNVDSVVRTLVARGLITELFTDPETGAINYGTTDALLVNLGINSLDELPHISPLLDDGADGFDARCAMTAAAGSRGRAPAEGARERRRGLAARVRAVHRRRARPGQRTGRHRAGRASTRHPTSSTSTARRSSSTHQALRHAQQADRRRLVDEGRERPPDLRRFTKEWDERLYNVGRLDAETSGLLVLTNDGDLAHVLAHPSFGVTKVYIAKVEGASAQTIARLTKGIELEDGPIAADKARLLDASGGTSLVELTLHSGRNRIVRRMMAAVGHPVVELVRRQFGPLHLGTLPAGRARELTTVERGALLTVARQADAPAVRR
jgi:pseudouridine synthase